MSYVVAVPAGVALWAVLTFHPGSAAAQSSGDELASRKAISGKISASSMNGCPSCTLSGRFTISFSSQVGPMASSTDPRNNIAIDDFELTYKGPSGSKTYGKDDVVISAIMNPATREPIDLQIHGADAGTNIAYAEAHDFAMSRMMTQYYDPALRDRGSKMVMGTLAPALTLGPATVTTAASAAATIVPPSAGKLMFENQLVRAYPVGSGSTKCYGAGLVFKVDESHVITSDENYRTLVVNEVLPKLRQVCPEAVARGTFAVDNYVDGWLIYNDAVLRPNELTRNYERLTPLALNQVVFMTENGTLTMKDLPQTALTSIRAKKIDVKLRKTQ